jgi:hypothetical protein
MNFICRDLIEVRRYYLLYWFVHDTHHNTEEENDYDLYP